MPGRDGTGLVGPGGGGDLNRQSRRGVGRGRMGGSASAGPGGFVNV